MLFRFVTTELATDIVITVGDVKFYLHKVQAHSSTCSLLSLNTTKLRFKPAVSDVFSLHSVEKKYLDIGTLDTCFISISDG